MIRMIGIFVTILGVVLMSGAVMAQPKLTIPENHFDFGYVPQHAAISHQYQLLSTGTDTLKILSLKPGCGCTKAPLQKSKLAPGDSTNLEVIFSTRSYSGPQKKRPSLTTNMGPDAVNVVFTAEVIINPEETTPIKIAPYKFDISQFDDKERKSLDFTITNVSDEPLEVKLVDIAPGMFKVDLPKKIGPGESKKGEIEILKAYIDQEFEKSMTIELNDRVKSRFTIPIKRSIRQLSSQTEN
nr:DUF1573 domain-containing protein [candidate division Zixibacteria bacterium]